MPWLAGAGLLAGGALLALIRHRRRQFRHRSPGRSITRTPAELQDAERALLTAGAGGMGDVNFLDRALRGLTRTAADGHAELPDVVAARLTDDALDLILAVPNHEPPAPWRSDDAGTTWTLSRDDRDDHDPRVEVGHGAEVYAPYPTLVSVGHTEAGEQWLLDLERVGYLSLTGDTDRCMDLARFIAAELAHNAWSDMVDVTLVGFGAEMTALNPERLTHTDNLETATAAATRVLADPPQDVDGNTAFRPRRPIAPGSGGGADPARHPDLPDRGPRGAAQRALGADRRAPQPTGPLGRRRGRRRRRSSAGVTTDDGTGSRTDRGWTLRVDGDGMLSIPALGVRLIAQQLPEREAADLAALLALAAATDDHPMPTSRGDQPWDEYADAAGNPLPQLTIPTPRHRESANPADPVEWRRRCRSRRCRCRPAPTWTAPPPTRPTWTPWPRGCRDAVRERIEKSDTDLDVDLADWYDDTTTRPRVSVLGPIQVRAQGELPAGRPRLAWHTEVVTYLATRPRGATVEAFGTAMWPDDPDIADRPKLRNSIYVARKWLGVDPTTGQEYLPANTRHRRRRLPHRRRPAGRGPVPPAPAPRRGPRRHRDPRPAGRVGPGHRSAVRPATPRRVRVAGRPRPGPRLPGRRSPTSRTCSPPTTWPPANRRSPRPPRRSRCWPAAAPTPCCWTWSRPATPMGNTAEADAYVQADHGQPRRRGRRGPPAADRRDPAPPPLATARGLTDGSIDMTWAAAVVRGRRDPGQPAAGGLDGRAHHRPRPRDLGHRGGGPGR